MIEKLFLAGADAFRVNMSHGDQQSKIAVIEAIRGLEKKLGRPSTILADLQGPKLRVGRFDGGRAMLETGRSEEHTSELQSIMSTSSAVFCLKQKKKRQTTI